MEKNRRVQKNILELTLERLLKLYEESGVRSGRLIRLGIKPWWNTVLGSNNECGVAANFTGIHAAHESRTENQKFLDLIGKTLFEIADQGIHATDCMERSVGVAALSALSQHYLGCSSVRDRGFLAQCWTNGDKLVRHYPTISRLVTRKDIVTVVGYGNEVRYLRGRCRELHVTDIRPKETFETVIIDKSITHGPRDIIVHSANENEHVLKIADVVIITASTLVNNAFEELMNYTSKARLVGLYGPGGSLIPDEFFKRDIDFITSFHISDPVRFSDDMINDHDMEFSIRTTQKQFMFMRPLAKTRGTPIQKILRKVVRS
jgi:uncharacterized protein (DUF4213/DUF364 family)